MKRKESEFFDKEKFRVLRNRIKSGELSISVNEAKRHCQLRFKPFYKSMNKYKEK